MNGLSNLTWALFGSGIAFIILFLIILCVQSSRNKKVWNGGTGFCLFLAILFLLGGISSVLFQNKIPANIQTLNILPLGSKEMHGSTVSAKPFVAEPFDPNGSVRPQILKDDTASGLGGYIDADGTRTIYHQGTYYYLLVMPDHTAYGFTNYVGHDESPAGADLFLFKPNGKTLPGQGNGCTEYEFLYDTTVPSTTISQCDSYFTNDFQYINNYQQTGGKMQYLNNTNMTPSDFLNQMLPEYDSTKPIENHILNGKYQYVDKQIVSSSTPVTLDFKGDDVIFKCDYLNVNDTYGYKLESAGKNAYRLYLYNRSVVKGDDGKYNKVMYAGQALKQPFFIYMDSKDSFDFVFFSDLDRHQVTMTR